jgi:Mlc titration factor MtfA (ptsG expression regulator)
MLFSWLKNRRRRQFTAPPFPDEWRPYLHDNVALITLLTEGEQQKLRDDLRIFIAERHWEGCGGLTLTDEIKVTIAAQACLLVLKMDHDYFSRVPSILVYPNGYKAPVERRNADGTVGADPGRLGEAWYRGPVVLAWDAVLASARDDRDGRNVVLHEFAHQLDFLDGYADGTPPLSSKAEYRRWHDVMTGEFKKLTQDSTTGKATVLDVYGATNPAEFFAVASEAFYEKPTQLKNGHSALYEVLRDYYRFDTAERVVQRQAWAHLHGGSGHSSISRPPH